MNSFCLFSLQLVLFLVFFDPVELRFRLREFLLVLEESLGVHLNFVGQEVGLPRDFEQPLPDPVEGQDLALVLLGEDFLEGNEDALVVGVSDGDAREARHRRVRGRLRNLPAIDGTWRGSGR